MWNCLFVILDQDGCGEKAVDQVVEAALAVELLQMAANQELPDRRDPKSSGYLILSQ